MNKTFFLVLVLLCFTQCGETFFYTQEIPINTEGWSYDKAKKFDFKIQEANQKYQAFLDIKHTPDYPYQNLYYQLKTTNPKGNVDKRMLSTNLADKTGQWYGSCNSTSCNVRINLEKEISFEDIGNYTIEIEQWTRDSLLQEVESIALHIQATAQK